MTFSYKPVGSGSFVVFYSDDGTANGLETNAVGSGAMPVYRPSFQSQQQETNLALSDQSTVKPGAAFRAPRGNTAASLALDYNNGYDTLEHAFDAYRTVKAALGDVLIHLSVRVGGTTHYYPNAVMGQYSANVQGLNVQHSIQFKSDDVTTTQPK